MSATKRAGNVMAPRRTAQVVARTARPPAAASMVGLQRSAGNTSALALLRRARKPAEEPPITLRLPGIAESIAVSSWSFDNNTRGTKVTGLHLTHPTDADSPALAQAASQGAEPVTATLVVRKLTPLGWVRELTLTMKECQIDSYLVGDRDDALGLTFSEMQVEL